MLFSLFNKLLLQPIASQEINQFYSVANISKYTVINISEADCLVSIYLTDRKTSGLTLTEF